MVTCWRTICSHGVMLRGAHILLGTSAFFGALLVGSLTIQTGDVLLYNRSNSVPTGLYLRVDQPVELGRFVTVRARDVSPSYAALRDFADADDRFIKRVAAGRGQVVCADGDTISIDGRVIAHRSEHDVLGRQLPAWSGCRTLGEQVLLLGDTPDSFDGRYWGPVTLASIEGVWETFCLRAPCTNCPRRLGR